MQARCREEVLNVVLAQCLSGLGLPSTPETIQRQHQTTSLPDVLVQYRGMRLAVEGKYDDVSKARSTVSQQAKDRISSAIAQIAVAIVYPSQLRSTPFQGLHDSLRDCPIQFCVHSEIGAGKWHEGSVIDVLDEIRSVHETMCREDVVQIAAESIKGCLDGVAMLWEPKLNVCEELSIVLGIGRPAKEDDETRRRRIQTTTRIAALTLENAFIFQEQLSASGVQGVTSLRDLTRKTAFVSATIKTWDWISKEINYVPIFKLASEILCKVPAGSASDGAIKTLAEKALEVCSNEAALRHDLMGRIYHYLLHEAKYLGTYYTSVPAATLLAKLALNPQRWNCDFSSNNELKNFRVADLACGTGTLLMAASQALLHNHVVGHAKKGQPVDGKMLGKMHATLMENVMHGYDVLPSAIHLTASTLSLLAPEVLFRELHLYSMPLAVKGTKALLGSLDFIEQPRLQTQFSLFESESTGTESRQITTGGLRGSTAELPTADLLIMNPPFTRSVGDNLLFGNLPDEKRSVMQDALKARISKAKLSANVTAGLGSAFVALADKYVKENGRLAFVLPAALATGVSWEETRKLIKRNYHLEYVVVSHDATRWNFSENTDLSELLFVARRLMRGESNDDQPTTFINLWRNPQNSGEALAVSRLISATAPARILDTKEAGVSNLLDLGAKYGEMTSVPMKSVEEVWWPTAFAQTELACTAWMLRSGKLKLPGIRRTWPVPMIELGSIADLGPDVRDIHDGFEAVDDPTSYPAFWNNKSGQTFCMSQAPNKFLSPRSTPAPGRKLIRSATLLWPKAAALLFAERLRLNTQKLTAIYCNKSVLANTWWPVRLKSNNPKKNKALALWQNSSLGLAMVLMSRVATEGAWVKFKKPSLLAMPVLNVDALTIDQLNVLSKHFDDLAHRSLQPLSNLVDDDVRIAIDLAIAAALELTDLSVLRQMLGQEPALTNRPLVQDDHSEIQNAKPQLELLFA